MQNIAIALFACGCVLLDATDAVSAFIDGAYGSREGCIYARTGDSSGADDFALLTSEAITGSTFSCEIRKATPQNKGFKVSASCQAEGEDQGTMSGITVMPSGKNAYTVNFDDGTKLGPLPKCR